MKSRHKLHIAMFALLFFFSACQPTPESETIIGGDFLQGLMEVPFVPYVAPERVEHENSESELKIVFDAQVSLPNASAYSVIEVEQIKYTAEDHKNNMEYFEPGGEWINEPQATKDELLALLYFIQMSDRFTDNEKKEFQDLGDKAASAPETVEYIEFDINGANASKRGVAWHERVMGEYASYSFNNTVNSWQYQRDAKASVMQEDFFNPAEIESDALIVTDFRKKPQIPIERALNIAEKTLLELQIDATLKPYYAKEAIAYLVREPIDYGWQIVFTRVCNGLQVQSNFDAWATWKSSPAPSHAAPWDPEMVVVFVAEDGLYGCSVRGLGRETKVLFHNVELLPFDQIMKRVSKQMVYQHAFEDGSTKDHAVYVTAIKLVSSRIDIKDRPGYGMQIPAWQVEYRFTYRDDSNLNHTDEYVTFFNAIDGSYIEPRATADMLGYN